MTKTPAKRAQGRHRKPVAPRKSPPVMPVMAVPRAPAWLSRPAQIEWRRTAPQLIQRSVLTTSDLPVLECFCSAKGRLVMAEEILARDGLIVTLGGGVLAKHPACAIVNEASQVIKTLGQQLGLTPASRSKAATSPTPGAANPWEGLLDG
jgi:P27 family predicted phage terminase small subunit